MVILNKKAFKLPRVETEKFKTLMHLGLEYNRNEGTFCIKSYDNIEKVIEAVSAILSNEVVFLQSCTICGKDFACTNCNYYEACTSRNLPFSCVCPQCLHDRKNLEVPISKF